MSNYFGFDVAGRRIRETNALAQVIKYTNSPAGDLLSLTDGKNQTTKWNYDEYGRVTNKVDQTGTEILRYGYDANDRLTNRWSAEKGNTGYGYDAVGNLTFIDYPSPTADVSLAYDRMNRRTNMTDSVGSTKWRYTASGQLASEDGPFASDTVTNIYFNHRRIALSLEQPTGAWTNGFAYDPANRFTNVTSSAGAFDYSYAVSGVRHRPKRLALPNTAYITNAFDTSARLTNTTLRSSGGSGLDLYTYVYNPANQRTTVARADASTVGYTYDGIGQLTNAVSSNNPEDRKYSYDAAWNMADHRSGPEWDPQLEDWFSYNSKNELTGSGEWGGFYSDANGNMTNMSEGSLVLSYDAENRLISLMALDGGSTFSYDGLGRLRAKDVYVPDPEDPDSFVFGYSVLYVYDGMRVVQERDGSNNPQVSYTRGPDLSSTLEGAGGIGGLLARSHGYNSGNFTNHSYYFADANGNVTYMLDQSQSMVASYRYDPFGTETAQSGSLADANVYRFSSKEICSAGFYYYGYRFYVPWLQRWVNRDPAGEVGGINLFVFVINSPTDFYDDLGMGPHPSGRRDPKGNPWPQSPPVPFPSGGPGGPRVLPPQEVNPKVPPNIPASAAAEALEMAGKALNAALEGLLENKGKQQCASKPHSPSGNSKCCVVNMLGDPGVYTGETTWTDSNGYVANKSCCEAAADDAKAGGLWPAGKEHETKYYAW